MRVCLPARYAFDVIGELYFGRMFGFMEQRTDYQSYIESLDTLLPLLTVASVAPSYTRPIILASAIINPAVRKGLRAIDHIAAAAKACVNKRAQDLAAGGEGTAIRRDLMQQLFEIARAKGDKVDFGHGEITYEAYVGLYVSSVLFSPFRLSYPLVRSELIVNMTANSGSRAQTLQRLP